MKIHEANLPNLRFKVLRQNEIKGYEIINLKDVGYDVEKWSREQNTPFGVNYLINQYGSVTRVLPDKYVAHISGIVNGEDNIIIGITHDTEAANEASDRLLEYLGYVEPQPVVGKVSDNEEAAKPLPSRSEAKGTKGKGKR